MPLQVHVQLQVQVQMQGQVNRNFDRKGDSICPLTVLVDLFRFVRFNESNTWRVHKTRAPLVRPVLARESVSGSRVRLEYPREINREISLRARVRDSEISGSPGNSILKISRTLNGKRLRH